MDKNKYNAFLFAVLFFTTLFVGTIGWRNCMGAADWPVTHSCFTSAGEASSLELWLESLYRTMLSFGGDSIYANPPTPTLAVTRFLGPATAITGILALLLAFLADRLLLWRARRRSGHVVVVGNSTFGMGWAERKGRQRRAPVTVIHQLGEPAGQSGRGLYMPTDLADAKALVAAVGRAPEVILFADGRSMDNIDRALVVTSTVKCGHVALRIEEERLSQDLHLLSDRLDRAEVVSEARTTARSLVSWLAPTDLAAIRGQPRVHIGLVGLGATGLALLEEFTIRCHVPGQEKVRLSVYDRDGDTARRLLATERPGLGLAAGQISVDQLDGLECGADIESDALLNREAEEPFTAIIVAAGDDSNNSSIAIRLRRLQVERGVLRAPILVRSRKRLVVAPAEVSLLTSGIEFFGGSVPNEADIRLEQIGSQLAQALHKRWRTAVGDAAAPDWSDLPWYQRRSSIRAAFSVLEVLRGSGLACEPASDLAGLALHPQAAAALRQEPGLLDRLAESEHERWSAERLADGWTFGEKRDDSRKRHPLLKPYGTLEAIDRQKNRTNIELLLEHQEAASNRVPLWRRRVRLLVFGPLVLRRSKSAIVEAARGMLRELLPLPSEAAHLEVITPNAPGFDRVAARIVLDDWFRLTGRRGDLLCIQAGSASLLDLMAAERLRAAPASAEPPEEQTRALIAAPAGRRRVFDMTPVGMTERDLATDAGRFMDLTLAVALRSAALSDLVLCDVDERKEGISWKTLCHLRALGVPLVDLGEPA